MCTFVHACIHILDKLFANNQMRLFCLFTFEWIKNNIMGNCCQKKKKTHLSSRSSAANRHLFSWCSSKTYTVINLHNVMRSSSYLFGGCNNDTFTRRLAYFSLLACNPVHTRGRPALSAHIRSHTNKTPMLNYAHKYPHTSQPSVGL